MAPKRERKSACGDSSLEKCESLSKAKKTSWKPRIWKPWGKQPEAADSLLVGCNCLWKLQLDLDIYEREHRDQPSCRFRERLVFLGDSLVATMSLNKDSYNCLGFLEATNVFCTLNLSFRELIFSFDLGGVSLRPFPFFTQTTGTFRVELAEITQKKILSFP